MKKRIFLYAALLGMATSFFSCEKDETKATLLDNPVVPVFQTIPNLTLQRANGTNMLKFVGTPLEPGFSASVTYYLEACAKGTNFIAPIAIISGSQDTSMTISVSDLNGILLKKFPADQASEVDFRIRAVLTAGTGSQPFEYSSETSSVNVTLYGLPRLDILSGITVAGKIESALGNGNYTGFVKLDNSLAYTLKDPDANIVYGGSTGVLTVNGATITPAKTGWHKLTANTQALTYTLDAYMIGLVGDATPNAWAAPDQKMNYNTATGAWTITLDLVDGSIKFRLNDDWGNGINLGLGDATHPEYTLTNLWNNGGSSNIPVTAGNYTITLYIGSTTYSCIITKN